MEEKKVLNDKELEKVAGGEISSANIVGYQADIKNNLDAPDKYKSYDKTWPQRHSKIKGGLQSERINEKNPEDNDSASARGLINSDVR